MPSTHLYRPPLHLDVGEEVVRLPLQLARHLQQYSTVQYSTVQYSAVHSSQVQHGAHFTVQYSTAHLATALPQVVDEAPQQHRVGLGLVARPRHVASTLTLEAYFYTNCRSQGIMEVSI